MRARLRTRATSPTAQPLAAKTYETKAIASIKFNGGHHRARAERQPLPNRDFECSVCMALLCVI